MHIYMTLIIIKMAAAVSTLIFKWAHYNERMKIFLLFLISLFLFQVFAEPFGVDSTSSTDIDVGHGASLFKLPRPNKKMFNCGYACAMRCREASRRNVCSRACKACCAECECVPPGTSGHTAACPCYASLRTHGNKPKCP